MCSVAKSTQGWPVSEAQLVEQEVDYLKVKGSCPATKNGKKTWLKKTGLLAPLSMGGGFQTIIILFGVRYHKNEPDIYSHLFVTKAPLI
jgi:hypothetical protein